MRKILPIITLLTIFQNCNAAEFPLKIEQPITYQYGSISYDIRGSSSIMSDLAGADRQVAIFKNHGNNSVQLFFAGEDLVGRMVYSNNEIYSFYPKEKKYSYDNTANEFPELANIQKVYDSLTSEQQKILQAYNQASGVVDTMESEDESEFVNPQYNINGQECRLEIDKSLFKDKNFISEHKYNCYIGDGIIYASNSVKVIDVDFTNKPDDNNFSTKIPTNYVKAPSMMQSMKILAKAQSKEEATKAPSKAEIKQYMLQLINNKQHISEINSKANNIINESTPIIANYMNHLTNNELVTQNDNDVDDAVAYNDDVVEEDQDDKLIDEAILDLGEEAVSNVLSSFF
ncbi:MAG: hypothetical protein GY951_16105 [Psychromonas sp.]|nr:hypothetical protein [Alteromonadales bacterium]MCP5079563.1 hypothetical protein [Psychromonas sp.]